MFALSHLETIDNQLNDLLSNETISVDVEEMARLLSERKACLIEITKNLDALDKDVWVIALERSQRIYNLIKKHRDGAAIKATRFLKGRKSIQIYKKFE